LAIPVVLNPDEGQSTVSARRILDDFVVWRSNDLTTNGPLSALVISWPFLFGLNPSILTSRLTGLLLQGGATLGIAKLIRAQEGFSPAVAAVLTLSAFLGLTADQNFDHFSSEDLSILLMVLFCAAFCKLRENTRAVLLWGICGLIASSLPLAKLQSAILCCLFHAACASCMMLDLFNRRVGRREMLSYFVGSALPVLLLVFPPFLVGEKQAVLTGYFGLGAGYIGHRTIVVFRSAAPIIGVTMALTELLALRYANDRSSRTVRWEVLSLGILLWPAIFLTIWLPGRDFVHYALYAIIGLPLAVVLVQRALPSAGQQMCNRLALSTTIVATLGLLWLELPSRQAAVAHAAVERRFAVADAAEYSRSLFAWAGVTSRDSLLMWGWEPNLTAYAGLRPADRAAHAYFLIRPTNGREYFRNRLIGDLGHGPKPALILDTVRPGYFFAKENYLDFEPETSTIRSFPALNTIVKTDYQEISTRPECAAIYLRRDLVAAWHGSEIPLRSSAPALVDNSFTENCNDWWAPEPSAAHATLSLEQPERVRELWILTSRGGIDTADRRFQLTTPTQKDRGTTRVKVRFIFSGGGVREQVVHLFDYPRWTVIPNDATQSVARIEIELLDFVGAGPALSEVKAFMKTSRNGT
jgi:hypothetical protein